MIKIRIKCKTLKLFIFDSILELILGVQRLAFTRKIIYNKANNENYRNVIYE